MKKNIFSFSILLVTVFAVTNSFAQVIILPNGATIPSLITAGQTIVCSNNQTFILDGKVYVQSGGAIQMGQGTIIKGVKKPTPAEASALVITRGASIDCQGTNTNPAVFTSNEPIPHVGDWGGIVLLGSAPLNRADTSIEGVDLPSLPIGVDVFYGGGGAGLGNPDQSSGIIRYARIEFAGANVTANNELNGLTFGGIGRGTEVDFVQAIYGSDDAFEWFGGTVNAKHLISYGNDDDSWDFDFGYNGHLQFVVSVESLSKPTYSSDPNGIESDNDATGSSATPRTNATISNMTVIGTEDSLNASEFLPAPGSKRILYGARFRKNSSLTVRNSIFMGFPTGVRFETANTITDAVRFADNIVHGFRVTDLGASIPASNTEILGNVSNSNATVQLTDPFNPTSPDFRPAVTSPAAAGANFSGLTTIPANFFTAPSTPTYRGAFPTTVQNWAASWSRFITFPL
jgi:hypothetical protein